MPTARTVLCWFSLLAVAACADPTDNVAFSSAVPESSSRVWVGPDYYANRLQDWRIQDGRIEAIEGRASKPMRTLHLLTRALGERPGTAQIEVVTGAIEPGPGHEDTWSGFLMGVGGQDVDYRISALSHHWPSDDGGLIVAFDGTGRIVVRDNSQNQGFRGPGRDVPLSAWPLIQPESSEISDQVFTAVRLSVQLKPDGETYRLTVTAQDPDTGSELGRATYSNIAAHQVSGNVALVSHRSPRLGGPERRPGYWFQDWTVSGSKVERMDERAFGPIMGALYTLSRGTLKMTAQLGPLGDGDSKVAALEVQRNGAWTEVASAEVMDLSYTAHFRLTDWASEEDIPYRVRYDMTVRGGGTEPRFFEGVIRREPVDQEEFVLAGFTGQYISGGDGQWNSDHFWYPHSDLTEAVATHDPDMLFFSGDQIYEGGLAGVVREPGREASIDYLYHWYRFVWAFRDLIRDRPTVTIPDDHDVYQGNIWGNAGVRAEGDFTPEHDRGGYLMEPAWVNAMHRTQVAHLPDSEDPEPLPNGITVYHTRMEYAGLSFAILADRMFKSSPSVVVKDGQVVNGWPQNRAFDAALSSDVEDAVLLGERQLRLLDRWAEDWSEGTWMKVLLSQTPFVDVATIPQDAMSGAGIPGLSVPEAGVFVEGQKVATDMDSNGWPQTGRDKAVRALRRGFAYHLAGDQHLSFFVQYGVDEWNDAGFGFAVPSIANLWPRRWYPPIAGDDPLPEAPRLTGNFLDGFGNHMRVLAVGNPTQVDVEPSALYRRAPGYGIVRFNRTTREIVSENWPRWVDPADGSSGQYPGWPVTVQQIDGYGRAPEAHLPTLVVQGMADPVVQVIHEETRKILYTLRVKGDRFRPMVFRAQGTFTLVVGEPGTARLKTVTGVTPTQDPAAELAIDLR